VSSDKAGIGRSTALDDRSETHRKCIGNEKARTECYYSAGVEFESSFIQDSCGFVPIVRNCWFSFCAVGQPSVLKDRQAAIAMMATPVGRRDYGVPMGSDIEMW
jgi:hypothetical protein